MVTGRGLTLSAGAVLLALVGLRFGVEEFVLIAVTASVLLAVGLGTLAVRVRRVRRGLQASVDIPLTTSVGEATAGRLTLVNEGPRWLAPMALSPPCWTVSYPGFRTVPWRVPAAPSAPRPPRRRLRVAPLGGDVALASGDRWERLVDIPTSARGLWTLDLVQLWCSDPLHLWCWAVPVRSPARVVVLPRVAPQQSGPRHRLARRLAADAPRLPSTTTSGSDDFAGLRRYVPGDRLARLHWPSVSRGGDLLVRQFVDDLAPGTLEITVDTRSWRVEQSVALAAAEGLAALDSGAQVTLRTSFGEQLAVAPGPLARLELLRALAVVAPQPDSHSTVLRDLPLARRQ